MIVDRTGGGVRAFIAADSLQQLCACADAIGVFNENCSVLNSCAVNTTDVPFRVTFDFPEVHDNAIKNDLTRPGRRVAVTQSHPQPCQELSRTKGFGDVIVGTHLQ